jgi:hypothetical protein
MDAGALKHIFIWIVLISLFFLLLFGVHLLFFPRVESQVIKEKSSVQPVLKNNSLLVFNKLCIKPCAVHIQKRGDK